ncbi:tetratricopeptide repeat protein [Streptomyces mirabilis]|uniref:tetratricopeptide repeat protein n=1 Tax=Streptomyces mirabilis TaxID=68239 RepID=UPI0036C643B3
MARPHLAKTNPAAHLPFLAMSLSNLGILFLEAGRREEALAPTQEAADHFRELGKANPAAHLANLTMSLSNLSVCLAQVGRREEAHALAQESVATRRARAKAHYSADSLLASAQQAVQNSRTLAKADSSTSWKSRFWRRLTGPQR